MQLEYTKAHHKITSRKSWHGSGLAKLPKFWIFPSNIYAVAEACNFKFGKPHHKIAQRGKVGVDLGWGRFQIFVVSILYYCKGGS